VGGGGVCTCAGTYEGAYLLVIEVIVCTEPDYHAEAQSLVHCVTPGVTLRGREGKSSPSHPH